jgi:hypothetical protein
MSETNPNFPIYFNGYIGNGETMKKITETLSKSNTHVEAFDFDKYRHLLYGNPLLSK